MSHRRLRPQYRLYSHKVTSWIGCLLRGSRRRQLRKRAELYSNLNSAELLEDRTLLSAVSFGEQIVDDMLDGANSVDVVDLDGDGDNDLLAVGSNANTVAWYESDGAATPAFTRHDIVTDRIGVTQALSADLDLDGDLDIVVATPSDDSIIWYENDGSENFTEVQISTSLTGASTIDLVDLDQDGDLDIVAGGTSTVAWFDNDGALDPTFTFTVIDIASTNVQSLTTSDIDADGDLDVIAASSGDNTLAWFENDGSESFTKNTVSTNVGGAKDVQVTDLDSDGDLDIVAAAKTDNRVLWFESNGATNPTFSTRVLASGTDLNGASSLAATDVDRDGDIDLVVASTNAGKLVWLDNDGDTFLPTFTLRELSDTVVGIQDIIVADIDGDGDSDLGIAQFSGDTISWFRDQTIHSSTTFPNPLELTRTSDGTYDVVLGDIDGDGDLDIVASSAYDNSIRWYEQNSQDGSFTARLVGNFANGPRGLHLADIDADGDLDIVSATAVDNRISWWTNLNGDGSAWFQNFANDTVLAARDVFTADLNGDGLVDILSASSGDDTIRWFQNTGVPLNNRFITRTIATNADGARSVFAADIDGDGDMDVMSASYYDDKIVWYQNIDGDGLTWAPRTISTNVDGARSIFAADVDNDGDVDILTASTFDHSIRWFENNGPALIPTFTENILSSGEQGAQFVTAADIDSDGDLDIVSVAAFPDTTDVSRIAWFENDGSAEPSFVRNTIDTKNDRPISAAVADLNGDGRMDVVSGSMLDDTVIVYFNEGGQIRFESSDTAPGFFPAGEFDDVMKITATHLGIPGDSDIEIASLDLKFEETIGDPLTSVEANNIIFDLEIVLDNGDGVYNVNDDPTIKVVDPLVLDSNGVLTVPFADGDPNVQITQGTPRTYFVVVELAANAFNQVPHQFVLTHLTTNTTKAEDAATDLPVNLEFVQNFSTGVIDIAPPDVPAPGIPVFLGPIGSTTDSTPTIQWSSSVGADRYDLKVVDLTTGSSVIDVSDIVGTSFTPLSPLEVGDIFEMMVRAVNVAGVRSNFGPAEFFTIDEPVLPPATPTLTGPAQNIEDTTPTITWTAETGADSYELLIYNFRKGKLVANPQGIVNTSITLGSPLPPDLYQVFVRATNAGGISNFSSPLMFETVLGIQALNVPSLTGPTSNIPTLVPTITWKMVPGAVNHQLLIYSITKGKEVLNVSNIVGEEFTPGSALPGADTYQVFVRANLGGGVFSGFSDPLVFVAESGDPIPAQTTVRTPTSPTTDTTPTIVWDRSPAADSYELVMYDVVRGQEVLFVTGISSRFHIPGAALTPSLYQVHVRGVNSSGEAGPWSMGHRFEVVAVLDTDLSAQQISEEILEGETELPLNPEIVKEAKRFAESDDVMVAQVENQRTNVEIIELEATAQIDSLMSEWHEAEWWQHEENPISSEQSSQNPLALGTAALLLGTNSLKKIRDTKKRRFFNRNK